MANQLINVLQIISSLEVGGSEKLLLDFLSACRDDDRINFTVVVMNTGVHPEMRRRLDRMGLNVYYLDRPESHMHPKYWWQLVQIIKRHRVQLLHAHNRGSKLWAMLCKLAMPQLKLVFTIHDTQMMPRLSTTQVLLHRYWIDSHIAISKTVAGLCEQRGVRNYEQIYNGIHLEPFHNSNRFNLRSRNLREPFSQRPLRILHVGRMDTPIKGQDVLVRAIHRCKQAGLNVRCMLMGGVYPYNQESFDVLQALVKALGLAEEISFHLNQLDVPEQMTQAELFILPSRAEGLGLVALEAMASGLPVIVSSLEGPRELVQEGVTGLLFEPENDEQLFEKIRLIYERPDWADAMREAASEWVKQFDIHEMKCRYDRLYRALLHVPGMAEIKQMNAGGLTHEVGI